MNRKITTTITAIVVVALIGVAVFALTRKADNNTGTNGTDTSNNSQTNESATYKQYAALKGEEYDRMFLAGMIAHHQGAVDMAQLALNQAKHSELKAMAQNIIKAQDKEIIDMTSWQQQWGYPASSGEQMMDHSAMSMEGDMMVMTDQLKNLTGDDFDKKFLELMIEHHQSAIDMARPGEANAQHQELKALTKAIVSDQTKEIDQMKTWQSEWGYKAAN
jgi:uncharacterized protein (DUF305 family)